MSSWRQQNPEVTCHAVWVLPDNGDLIAIRTWYNLCCMYGIWGHLIESEEGLVEFLKTLDQPRQYIPFEPFLKKSHEEPTLMARMLRQFPGISSQKAIEIAGSGYWQCWYRLFDEGGLRANPRAMLSDALGQKKDGTPKKITLDLIRWLETGELPNDSA